MPATVQIVECCGFLRKLQLQNRLHCRRKRHWLLSISHVRLENLISDPLGLHQGVYKPQRAVADCDLDSTRGSDGAGGAIA